MALDIRHLTAADLLRLVNSTPLGTVLTERRLYRHRMQAGLRIGTADRLSLVRYVGWLAGLSAEASAKAGRSTAMPGEPHERQAILQYERHRARAARRQADIAEAGQEIGPPPPVVDQTRREACRRDFGLFCRTYLAGWFYLRFSQDHLKAIRKIEDAVLKGRLFALAMPRGGGKTWLCLAAVLWAILYAHHRFVVLIAATERLARRLLRRLYTQLERNAMLLADFPEVCHPIRALERTPQRGMKQKSDGRYTSVVWTTTEIVLPTVTIQGKLTPSSGAIITVCGLTGGEIRGQTREGADGRALRPTLVLLDDPQTRASARSVAQTQERVELLMGDVLGMAGPDTALAGMMTVTVIEPGDMADQILDPQKHPEWHGERMAMVYAWPTNQKLWDEYAKLWAEGLRRGDGGAEATEFYRKNRAAMDAGSIVGWEDRFPPDCISAIQHAVNLRLRDEAAFMAEYQNAPPLQESSVEVVLADQIVEKVSGLPRGKLPDSAEHLVAFIDVHDRLLFYIVVAWEKDFTGQVVDWGTMPDQHEPYFTLRGARRTLARVHPGTGREGAITAGLHDLHEHLKRDWPREDGAAMRVEMCLVDSGWEPEIVHGFIRQAGSPIFLASKGIRLGAESVPWEDWTRKPGERVGDRWRIRTVRSRRLALLDTGYWKTFLQRRLAVARGDRGGISLFGRQPSVHRLLADQLTAEGCKTKTGMRGGKIDVWLPLPGRADNHLLDCLVGCCAAASMLGVAVPGQPVLSAAPPRARRKATVKFG